MRRSTEFASLAVLLFLPATASAGADRQTGNSQREFAAIEPVLHSLCGRRVALLGESPVHGFGEALAFKDELVRRLVDECHYNALFFESGTYDFIHIEKTLRSGQHVTDGMISAAIGGIWHNEEVQSLVPFLTEKANAGSLTLGGLDDQIGAGTWASRDMAVDLVQDLPGEEMSRCLGILQRHLSWQYSDEAPYNPSDKTQILGCLDEIDDRLPQTGESLQSSSAGDQAIIESLRRRLARDFTEDEPAKSDQDLKWKNDRDRSMYLNFHWLFSRLSPHSKAIVWTATVHAAKTLNGVSGFEGSVPMGSFIRKDFGDRAFVLGFSAYSGEYAFVHQPIRQLSIAPSSSLEGRMFANPEADGLFLPRNQLAKFGAVAARPLGTTFSTAQWNKVVDGLVIFRREHAPTWLHH
jgi:erythromycin esterase-like protein